MVFFHPKKGGWQDEFPNYQLRVKKQHKSPRKFNSSAKAPSKSWGWKTVASPFGGFGNFSGAFAVKLYKPQFRYGWLSREKWLEIISGQIIATSHDLTPNGDLVREIPLFQVFPGW